MSVNSHISVHTAHACTDVSIHTMVIDVHI